MNNFNGFSQDELADALKKSSEGSQKAFAIIFKAFSKPIVRHICKEYKICNEVAIDLSNEILSKVWQKSSYYTPDKGLVSTWIYSITEFHVIDYFRREQTKQNYFAIYNLAIMDVQILASIHNISKPILNPERIYLNIERAEYISKLFGKNVIGELFLKAMKLRYVEELSLKEIAKELEMNENTVRVYIMRGRQKVQDFVYSNSEYLDVIFK